MNFLVENNLNNSKKTFSEYHSGDPFSSFNFLNALQETNCLDSDSGWIAKCLNHTEIKMYLKRLMIGIYQYILTQ